MRDVTDVHTTVCGHCSFGPSKKEGGVISQYQTYQRYVRVVVLGVLGYAVLWAVRRCLAH